MSERSDFYRKTVEAPQEITLLKLEALEDNAKSLAELTHDTLMVWRRLIGINTDIVEEYAEPLPF